MIRLLAFAIVLALAGAGFAQKAPLPPPVWKAGAASVKITPETLMKWGAHPAPWSEQVKEQIVGELHRLRRLLE